MEQNKYRLALATELTRLIQSGLTPEEELIARRYYSDKERQGMDEGDFCGPHKSFPVKSQEDVTNAAHLVGHADDPAAVKQCIIGKAHANGWSLPDAWTADDSKERAAAGEMVLNRVSADHGPMTATHTHSHPAYGDQGEDGNHDHEHDHNDDNNHHHAHAERAAGAALQTSNRLVMSLPLTRIDATKREVWGQATAEVPDSYGTIFGYYPDAWTKWRGNIREQHDPKKAVGKAVEVQPNPQERAIYVGSRVSRGAQDTWLKVEEDVLTGYSASIIPDAEFGYDTKKWPTKEYGGKLYPYLPRYTVAELSLVDNPACPGCDIQIVRADGFATDVLDLSDEELTSTPAILERVGARVSAPTRAANHEAIAHVLHGAVAMMKNCGPECDSCMQAQKLIDPDGDGDIDIGSFDDPDGDAADLYNDRDSDMKRVLRSALEHLLPDAIERMLSPAYSRLQGIAGTMARGNSAPAIPDDFADTLTRAIEAATNASLEAVRADLSAIKDTVDKVADTPMPGAPIQNANAAPRPVDKRIPTDPYAAPRRSTSSVYDAVALLSEAGQLNTVEKQVDAMAVALAAQRRS